ncbi:MAG: hypothetical protein AAFV29_14670 [Myxococcota bacterium]
MADVVLALAATARLVGVRLAGAFAAVVLAAVVLAAVRGRLLVSLAGDFFWAEVF